MVNIIIADDEKLIREGLKTIIDWEEQGYTIKALAKDGDECLELLLKHKPEACIIDIRMPGLSGLDVIKEVRSRGLNIHFIILSGHQDFGYVKQALTYHADNYLLKPIDEVELIESLFQVRKYISAEKSINNPINKERQLKTYFRSFLGLSTEKLPVLDEKDINRDFFQILLIYLPDDVTTRIDDWATKNNIGLVLSTGVLTTILLNQYYLRSAGIKEINRIFGELLKGKPYDGCLSSSVNSIEELPDALDEVEDLLDKRFFSEQKGITSKHYFKTAAKPSDISLDLKSNIPIIQKLIEVGNEKQIEFVLQELSVRMINEDYTESMIKDWFCELSIGALTAIVRDNNLAKDRITGNSELIMEIQSCLRVFELINKLVKILTNAIDKQEIQSIETIIKKMKFIVEKHYMDNIKLKDLSDILNYNSAYLGKLFKTEVGESFSVYLDKHRISIAKELLRDGHKVYQVAKKVGYSYVDYFHAKFKKYEGMSPLEYRNIK